jgi:prenyltransferase beta subunit
MPMNRRIFASLLSVALLAVAAVAAPPTAEERAASVRFLNSLENPDGGFRAAVADGKSELKNMPAATRGVHHFGGQVAHGRRVAKFVMDHYDAATGSFHETDASPDVRTTALGLMTLAELKAPYSEQAPAIARYLERNAHEVPDLYIAEAALEAAGLQPSDPKAWLAPFDATHHADGSYGAGAADTGRAVCTYLRLKQPLPDRAGALRSLRAAQNADGGFGASGSTSDLTTSYPVMRAFSMLKEKPDLARMRGFVERCRNADGGYGVTPGAPSTVTGTYYASIIQFWAEELEK